MENYSHSATRSDFRAKRMGRKKKFTETTIVRCVDGTFARIEAVLGQVEDRADFIRQAIERELARREERGETAARKPSRPVKRRRAAS